MTRDPREPWPTRKTRRVHNGWLQLYRSEVQLPDGEWCLDFYRVALRPYVVVVPMTRDGNVLALEAYRHGPDDVLTEFPGGMLEPDETPLQAARRELREETGYEAAEWVELPLRGVITDPNHDCGAGYYFKAAALTKAAEPDGSGVLVTLSVTQFRNALLGQQRQTALPTLAALCAVDSMMWKRCA